MLIDKLERAFVRLVLLLFGSLKIVGLENIPVEGPYILAVNHMSKADPPLVMISWPPMAKIRFFAAEKWEKHLIFGPLMRHQGAIYINRGEVDRRALRQALAALGEGAVFGLAPEGTRSRVAALIQARDGAAYLASRAGVPIVPVGMVNTDLLGHNMAHLRRTHLETRIGQPFSLPDTVHRPKGDELVVPVAIEIEEEIKAIGYREVLNALLKGEDPWPACLDVSKAAVPQPET